MPLEQEAATRLAAFLDALPSGRETRIHILTDSDCDGLPAGALLVRALTLAGYPNVTIEPKRKGESAWLPEVIAASPCASRRPSSSSTSAAAPTRCSPASQRC